MKARHTLILRSLSSAPIVAMVVVTMILGVLPSLPAEDAAAQGAGQYYGSKYQCPPGYDLEHSSVDDAFANCTLPVEGPLTFTIRSDDPSYQGSSQQSSGQFGWTDVPFGSRYFVAETLPRVIWNRGSIEISQFAAGGGDFRTFYFQAPGGEMFVAGDLVNYEMTSCYWFNVAAGDHQTTGSTISIEKRLCDEDYDPVAKSLDDLYQHCDAFLSGVKYTLNNDGNTERETDQNGHATFEGVNAGDTRIRELKAPSYQPARVFCQTHPSADPNVVYEQQNELPVTEEEGAWYVDTAAIEGNKVDCVWFNVPLHEGATLYIQKKLCPQGFDFSAATIGDIDASCTSPHEGVYFEVPFNSGGHNDTTNDEGEARITGLPWGPIEIHEQSTPGHSLGAVYCFSSEDPKEGFESDDLVPFKDDTSQSGYYGVQYDIPEGHDLYCYFFNAPVDDAPGIIEVTKYICPPEYDSHSGDLSALLDNCTTPHEGAGINLHNGQGQYGGGTDASGAMRWEDFPPGPVTLLEQTAGYALVRVYCHGVPGNQTNNTVAEYAEFSVYSEDGFYRADAHLEPGYLLHCYLFNVATDTEYATVYAYKYDCPEGFDYEGGGRDYLFQNCTETPDIHFSLDIESPEFHEEWLVNPDGWAVFDQVPPREFLLTEEPQDGYQLVAVFCGVTAQNSLTLPTSWESMAFSGGVQYEPAANEYVHCEFYNAPSDYGSIDITKYLCGPISLPVDGGGPTYETFSQQCTDIGSGFQFVASSGGADYPGQTDNTGTVQWSNLQPGDYSIAEKLPPGYDSWAVYCTSDPQGTYQEYASQQQFSFDYTVEPGATLYCKWFNAAPPTDTHVEIVKYRCPEGYDYSSGNYQDLLTNCANVIENVSFTFSNESGYASEQLTNVEGVATWNSVPAGTVYMQEAPVPQHIPVRVYCSNTPNENSQPAPFQGYDVDTNGRFIVVEVTEGYRLVCHWFNAPVEVETGQVLVTKYICDPFLTRGEPGYQDYVDHCTTPGEGFHFTLFDKNQLIMDEGTTGANGTVPLLSSPPGSNYIVETETEDYITLAVFCTTDQANPPVSPEGDPPLIDTSPDFTVYCSWFNAPAHTSPYEPGSIVIHKFDCPPGYPTTPQGGRSPNSWFFEGCQQPASGVTFNVEQGGSTVATGETDSSGDVVMTGIPVGSTRIAELPREGWGPPVVLCASYPVVDGRVLVSFDEQIVDNWGITYDRTQDYVLECYWFDFPPSEGNPGQPIQILVHKYLCDDGYQYSGQDYQMLSTDCPIAENLVNFDIVGGDGGTSGGPTDINGYAEYNGVASGSILITETPREGYKTLAVYCTAYVTSPGTPSLFPTEGGQLSYYLADGYRLECYWYNAPVQDRGYISIVKYTCHEDFAYGSASLEDLESNCTSPQPGVTFKLSGPAGYNSDDVTDTEGRAGWPDLPAGTYTLTEAPPTGYYPVRIFCTVFPLDGPYPDDLAYPGTWTDYTASPDNILDISLDVQDGFAIYCLWFDAPVEHNTWVDVTKYVCAFDYDATLKSHEQLRTDCQDYGSNIDFTVSIDQYSETATTDHEGRAHWSDVPPGKISMRESATGYEPVRIFCTAAEGGNYDPPPAPWSDYSGVSEIQVDTQPGYHVYCEWFNVPYKVTLPQVWIQKYNCEPGADWHWSYHQFLSNCHQPGANVEFGVGEDEHSLSLAVTDASGRIWLGDQQPGTLVIREEFPSGYAGFVVFCQFSAPDHTGEYQRADVYNKSITLQLEYGYVVTCVFFDLPAGYEPPEVSPPTTGQTPLQPISQGNGTIGLPPVDPNTPANLIITKYTCDEGYDVLADDADPALDCDTLTNDILYSLAGISDPNFLPRERITGDDGEGKIEFANLPAGSYLLTETLPEGTIAAFIYTCESDRRDFQQDNPFIPFAFAGPDGRIGVTLEAGETLECDWFDVPEDVLGGQVTVTKYTCPGTSVIKAQCTVFTGGATIGLYPVDDVSADPIELTTGQDGTATAPAEGVYEVLEIPITACLIDSDAFDAEGNLVVHEGDDVAVDVYNCGS
ncbi:MAG: prealbumin-like fold domain-containing protein [Thermomicrobiales bacterium]